MPKNPLKKMKVDEDFMRASRLFLSIERAPGLIAAQAPGPDAVVIGERRTRSVLMTRSHLRTRFNVK